MVPMGRVTAVRREQGRRGRALAGSPWFALSAVALLIFSACSSAPPAGQSPGAGTPAAPGASAEGTPVTGTSCAANATVVKFWTSHTPPDSDVIKKIVDTYNQANPSVCVKMTLVKGSETDIAKLQLAVRGGVGPDVYEADRFTVPQRAKEGVLAELPEADIAGIKDQHVEFAWNETQYKGKTYALPFDTDARALWYNKDLIGADAAAQLDISKGPPTIDLVTQIADKVSKKDSSGNYSVLGWIPGGPGNSGAGAFDQGWHYTWGFVYGGKFADLASCKVTPTDPGVVAGFQFMYDWQKAHNPQAVARFVSTNWLPNAAAGTNPFWTGKLAMTISGDWRIAEAAKYAPNGHYGFTYIPVPKAGDKSATWAGGWSMALIPGAKAPKEAIAFIKYITGPDGQRVYAKDSAHLPTLKALQADPSLFDAQHRTFLELLPTALNRPPLPVGALYWDKLTAAQGSVELNTKQPMDALKEVEAAVQPQLTSAGC